MLTTFRKNIHSQEGQTIILGAVMVLILAFGLLVTINLGQMVQDKIRLQNTSDSAAYSLAVSEAQTFNFMAFTNRTQAAHYNGFMTVQTIQTLALFLESMAGTVLDFIWFIAGILQYFPYIGSAIQSAARFIGGVVKGISTVVDVVLKVGSVSKTILTYANIGQFIALGIYVGLLSINNFIEAWKFGKKNEPRVENTSIPSLVFTGISALEFGQAFDWKTITKIKDIPVETKDGYADPSNRGDEVNQNLGIMGEISNATRTENSNFLNNTNRGTSISFPSSFISIFRIRTAGQTKIVATNSNISGDETVAHVKIPEVVEDIRKNEANNPGSRKEVGASSQFARGDTVASDQALYLFVGLGVKVGSFEFNLFGQELKNGVYMLSDNYHGRYWRWRKPANDGFSGMIYGSENDNLQFNYALYLRVPINFWNVIPSLFRGTIIVLAYAECGFFPVRWKSSSSNDNTCGSSFLTSQGEYQRWSLRKGWRRCGSKFGPASFRHYLDREIQTHKLWCYDEDKNNGFANQTHKGIYKYFKFNPKSERNKDFNQPSTWSLLNIPTKQATGTSEDKKPWHLTSNVDIGTKSNRFSTTDPKLEGGNTPYSSYKFMNVLEPGINTLTRASAYYHRPGNWNEHPNFFNPYWRAQLAPIAPRLQRYISEPMNGFLNYINEMKDSFNNSMGGGNHGLIDDITGMIGNIVDGIVNALTNLVQRVVTH